MKRKGFADKRIANLLNCMNQLFVKNEEVLVLQSYKRVDTCGIFNCHCLYVFDPEPHCESNPSERDKIIVLGGGPNRIGQGIEFDYCCVHAALAMREDGYENYHG